MEKFGRVLIQPIKLVTGGARICDLRITRKASLPPDHQKCAIRVNPGTVQTLHYPLIRNFLAVVKLYVPDLRGASAGH